MRILLSLSILLAIATGFGAAQSENVIGSIDELKGLTKVYVSSNVGNREVMIKEIRSSKSGLTVVDNMDDADFFLNFQVTISEARRIFYSPLRTGQLDVYLRKGERLRTVWSKDGSGTTTYDSLAKSVTKRFIKDLRLSDPR